MMSQQSPPSAVPPSWLTPSQLFGGIHLKSALFNHYCFVRSLQQSFQLIIFEALFFYWLLDCCYLCVSRFTCPFVVLTANSQWWWRCSAGNKMVGGFISIGFALGCSGEFYQATIRPPSITFDWSGRVSQKRGSLLIDWQTCILS